MKKYRRLTQVFYVLLVILSIWLIAPVMAGGGDPVVAQKAWPMINSGVLLIDVRTQQEFSAGHVEGALNIEWEQTDSLMAAIGEDLSRPVVVYCRSGNRSGKAKSLLESRGYTNVFNATGYGALMETKP